MKFIDSHCHLHDPEFFSPALAEQVLARSIEHGVDRVIVIGTSADDSRQAISFAEAHPDNVYATIGVHPHGNGYDDIASQQLGAAKQLAELQSERLVAIGEIGLDYHYPGYDRDGQTQLFEEMMQLAHDRDLPVVFHVREAFADIWPVIDNFPGVRGVMHSFTDNRENLDAALKRGFFVGVNGIVTFAKNIPLPPLDQMLLETDAPFLAPLPHRGKTNEPAFIPDIARWIAAKIGEPLPVVAEKTTANTTKLFKLS